MQHSSRDACPARGIAVLKGVAALVMAGILLRPMDAPRFTTAVVSLVCDRVTVIDVEQGKLVPDQRVIIEGEPDHAVPSSSRRDRIIV